MYECHTCEYKAKEKRCSILNRDLHGSLKTQGCGLYKTVKENKIITATEVLNYVNQYKLF